jgi:hypothetical protein
LISIMLTTWSTWRMVMNGRWCSILNMGHLNGWLFQRPDQHALCISKIHEQHLQWYAGHLSHHLPQWHPDLLQRQFIPASHVCAQGATPSS